MTFGDIQTRSFWGWSHPAAWGPGGLGTTTDTVPKDFGMGEMAVWEGKQHEGQVTGIQLLEIINFKARRLLPDLLFFSKYHFSNPYF